MRTHEKTCMSSFVVLLVAFLLLVLGVALPHWYGTSLSRVGLFLTCEDDGDNCENIQLDDAEDWWQGTVALCLLAIILAGLAALTAMFLPITGTLQITAGLFAIIGAAIFGSEIDDFNDIDLDWAFVITIVAGIILLLNGITISVYAAMHSCSMQMITPCNRRYRGKGYYGKAYGHSYGYRGRRPLPPLQPLPPPPRLPPPSLPPTSYLAESSGYYQSTTMPVPSHGVILPPLKAHYPQRTYLAPSHLVAPTPGYYTGSRHVPTLSGNSKLGGF